jgi:hypothetical protein
MKYNELQELSTDGSNQIAVIYFPTRDHVELLVDEKTYNLFGFCKGPYDVHDGANIREKSLQGQLSPHIKITIHVSEEEMNRIRRAVESKFRPAWSCSGNAGRVISKNTGLKIPFSQAITPFRLYKYLEKKCFELNSPVRQIEWIQKGQVERIQSEGKTKIHEDPQAERRVIPLEDALEESKNLTRLLLEERMNICFCLASASSSIGMAVL